jgi:hypothetical protein
VLAGLCGLNVYVFFVRGGTSLRDVLHAQSTAPLAPAPARPVAPRARLSEGTVATGETLQAALTREGFAPTQAQVVARLLAPAHPPRAGSRYRIAYDAEGEPQSVELRALRVTPRRAERSPSGWRAARP